MNQYNNEIFTYVNDYELLTFHYLRINYRKMIKSYNNTKDLVSMHIIPVPDGIKIDYLGRCETYYYDIKQYFPTETKIIDDCSNVGASTISLSFDFKKVIGIEIDINY